VNRFFTLTPDLILDAVESALGSKKSGMRATGRAQALNSIENRVYEVEFEDSSSVVTKFYRPGRWSPEQIFEEHALLDALQENEIPVVPPLTLQDGPVSRLASGGARKTLAANEDGILFAVFPKMRGRSRDELNSLELEVLGRLLGRLHMVARSRTRGSTRLHLNVDTYGRESLKILVESGHLEGPLKSRYISYTENLCDRIAFRMSDAAVQLVHGDCHLGNLLWNESGPFFVDFDDMVVAPPVQDMWMISGGRDDYARRQLETLVEAYEEMAPFDRSSLGLIEGLRALRLIHYSAWIAQRWQDPSFPRMFPHFGSERYWQEEIEALSEILAIIDEGRIEA
jgi:Ser/Thr protein kinase RdoA (MazF antagonist)